MLDGQAVSLMEPKICRAERIGWADGRILSLMALLTFYADEFCKASGILAQAWVLINKTGGLDRQAIEALGSTLGDLQRQCEQIELPMTGRRLQRLLDTFRPDYAHTWIETARQLAEIQQTLIDELEDRLVLCLPADKGSFYTGHDLFGPDVARQFSSASREITEAGRCLALNRNTASVFHLMRVMEIGLRALGRSLNEPQLDPKRNPSWEMILRRCDQEMQKPLAQRSPEWQQAESFYSTATANLRAVKDAWRNSTMHVEQTYDDETALEVWNTVRAFMRQIATRLADA
ncbi:MAG: hypothetical protein ACLQDM_09785 [Bradyrhizobium sp.]